VEPGAPVLRAVVGYEVGVLGPHLRDVVQGSEERPLLIADEFRHADDPDGGPAGGDGHGRPDQPLLVPNDDPGARRKHGFGCHETPPRPVLPKTSSRMSSLPLGSLMPLTLEGGLVVPSRPPFVTVTGKSERPRWVPAIA